MFSTGPAAQPGHAGPLRLHRAGRQVFDESSDLALDPQLGIFLGDMVRPYGLALRPDLLAAGSGQSYGEMAQAVLRATVPAAEPVDLLVLAFAMHDIRLGRATAVYLSRVCPGEPMAFAVCDQGAAAAFTGLRLVHDYARTGGCRRAVLLVVEQSTVHYEPPAVPAPALPVPDRHAAVALLFDAAGPAEPVTVRQHAGVAPDHVDRLLEAELTALCPDGPELAVILGSGLTGRPAWPTAGAPPAGRAPGAPPRPRLRAAPAGQPFTGVWWELVGGLPEWTVDGRRVVLADYDAGLGYLSVATIGIDGQLGRAAPRLAARGERSTR
jgi:4-hydroxymandelate oxidase